MAGGRNPTYSGWGTEYSRGETRGEGYDFEGAGLRPVRDAGGEIRGFTKRVRKNCEHKIWGVFDKIVEEFGWFSHEAPILLESKLFHKY